MTVPPVVEPPSFQFDLPERRHIGGWLVLIAIFSLMVGMQLAQYLSRDRGEPESKYVASARQLKIAVEMKQSITSFGIKDVSGFTSTYVSLEKALEKDASKNPIAARIYAASRSDRGEKVPDEVLKQLHASKERRDKLFAEVFSAEKIEPARAKELEVLLSGGGFISKLARIQAFEKAGDSSRRKEIISQGRALFRMAVMSTAGVALFAGILLWVVFLVFKSQGKLPRLGLPLERISLADADKLALRCAQLFVMFLAVPLAASVLSRGVDKHLGNLVLYAVLLAGTVLLFRFPIGNRMFTLAGIGITKENLGKNIGWGVATAVANMPLVLATALLGQWIFSGLPAPEHPTTVEIETGLGWFGTMVILFAASVGAPIMEEIMFRGTLLPALARVMGRPVVAILLQGLIFAAIHPTGVPAWLPLMAIGSMSGFVARQTGSLVPSIVMHAVHNFGTLMIAQSMLGSG